VTDLSKPLLIIDSDERRQHQLKEWLSASGHSTIYSAGPSEWSNKLETSASGVHVALLGPCANVSEQQKLYEALRVRRPHLPIILFGEKESSMALPPADTSTAFVRKVQLPIDRTVLTEVLIQAVKYADDRAGDGARNPELFRSLVGKSEGVRHVRQLIERVAQSDSTVLILGESGTGKEVVARNLHYRSQRRGKPFIAVNCGAIPADLLESELFGHEKGAFTGAVSARQGRFELAAGGTLFLDEIGEMSLAMQVKLLRVIQERTYERVGGDRSLRVDVRLIAATHRDLEREVQAKRFREDLYYRLNVFPITMPPLRDRSEDIPLLVAELNARLRQERGSGVRFSSDAMLALQRYSWPGNVRELANLVERLTILYPDATVDTKELPAQYQAETRVGITPSATAAEAPMPLPTLPAAGVDLKEYLGNVEYTLIMQALTRTGGVVAHAANLLKLRRTTLVEKLYKYGVRRERAGAIQEGTPVEDAEAPPN
jgi:sigma-54 dependent transcriptional regulator, flagellar regulatory protein